MKLPTLSRRRVLKSAVFGLTLAVPTLAWAGSYLDRAALLVSEANTELDYLRRKLNDRELARVVHELSTARLRAAREMMVPEEVTQAHPHLMLLLENCERAAANAEEGRPTIFVKFLQMARDEEQHFRAILKQLGWMLPGP